jgi:hypothetical protein
LGQRPSLARRSIPEVTRSTIVACSNSAKTPSICSIIRPAAPLADYEYSLSSSEVLTRSTLPFEIPATVEHGSHVYVYVVCVDLSSATVGHPVPAFEYFRPGIVAVS